MSSYILNWNVIGWVVSIIFAVGLSAAFTTPPEHTIVYVCFPLAAIILVIRGIWWMLEQPGSLAFHSLLVFICSGAIISLCFFSIKWVSNRKHAYDTQTAQAATSVKTTTLQPSSPKDNPIVDANSEQGRRKSRSITPTPQAQTLPSQAPPQAAPSQAPPQAAPPQIIVQLPLMGNLKQRAIALSEEIMEDLYLHGWYLPPELKGKFIPFNQMPAGEAKKQWLLSRSMTFETRYYKRVLDIKNEFADLHLKDEQLDDFVKSQATYEDFAKLTPSAVIVQRPFGRFSAMEIARVAERIKALSEHIK